MGAFISYSSRDKEWVRGELRRRIERARFKAFIDFRDLTGVAAGAMRCSLRRSTDLANFNEPRLYCGVFLQSRNTHPLLRINSALIATLSPRRND